MTSTLDCASFLSSAVFSSFLSLLSYTVLKPVLKHLLSRTYNVLIQALLLLSRYLRMLRSQFFAEFLLPGLLLALRERRYLRRIGIGRNIRSLLLLLPMPLLSLARNKLRHCDTVPLLGSEEQ